MKFIPQYQTESKFPLISQIHHYQGRGVSQRGERYSVSPFALIYAEENYYLLAFDSKEEIFKHYRVDRTKNIKVSVNDKEGIEQLIK